jgi:hypothetical protein
MTSELKKIDDMITTFGKQVTADINAAVDKAFGNAAKPPAKPESYISKSSENNCRR